MFPKLKNNNSGIVLLTVLMMTVVMMVYAISILSTNVSEVISSKGQVEHIKAEQLAKGAFWLNYSSIMTTNSLTSVPAETLDYKTYSTTVSRNPGGPNSTDSLTLTTSY